MDSIGQTVRSIKDLYDAREVSDVTHDPYKSGQKTRPQIDRSEQYLVDKYLTPKLAFSQDWVDQFQDVSYVDKSAMYRRLMSVPDFASRTGIKYDRKGLEGQITGIREFVETPDDIHSKNSFKLTRQMGSKLDFVRGRAGFVPFAPGGVELSEQPEKSFVLHRDEQGLFDVPPGFSRGMNVSSVNVSSEESTMLTEDPDNNDATAEEDEQEEQLVEGIRSFKFSDSTNGEASEIDSLLPQDITFGRTSMALIANAPAKVKEWAHVVDVNKTIDNFDELVPNPARIFPFELDVFQKEAVYHLEQGDSVFVAAHTSAGKTVVAEYAISMANRNMTKTIYTSPIKALSNQKYRDFKQIYDDVGILTGDVQINPEASCLIMTTEILRSMLYRGADLIRDVEFVIFDEVHYVNDQDRGVVWEEVIIMLPDHVKFILLSATVPNTFEFANWVGRTKQKDIYVISTPKRPVPLENFLWAKNKKYLLVDSKKNFLESGWKAASDAVSPRNDADNKSGGSDRGGRGGARGGASRGGAPRGGAQRGRGRGGGFAAASRIPQQRSGRNMNYPGKTSLTQLCQHLHGNKLLPAVIFVFSKKRCEEFATMLSSLDYCSAKEKSEIHMFIDKAVSRLRKEDRELPQIMMVRDLLSRGIGIHHGGLLPIIKEVIEILFARTLVKVLFATETFAMGLNLPTKTVVFANTSKHDGKTFRQLLPGEYTQMAGRAGRRGLDATGTVILMVNGQEVPPVADLRTMMLGMPTKLQSQFRLTYNMILNLLRIEALKVEDMIKRSFSENAAQVLLPEHEQNVKKNEESLTQLKRDSCSTCDKDIDEVHGLIVKQAEMQSEIIAMVIKTLYGRRLCGPGRVIVYKSEEKEAYCTGVIIRSNFKNLSVMCLGELKEEKTKVPFLPQVPKFPADKLLGKFVRVPFREKLVSFESIVMVVDRIIDCNFRSLIRREDETIKKVRKDVEHLFQKWSRFQDVPWKGIRDAETADKVRERSGCLTKIGESESIKCPDFLKTYLQVHEQYLVKQQIESLKRLISDQNMELLPDYEQRVEVLKDLNYVDTEQNVLLKGRVACEISTGFELIITELILDNFLGDYEPEEIVALMSAFVFEGNTDIEVESVTPRLDQGRARILDIAATTNQVFEKHQVLMTQEESEFGERKRFGLMEVVYEWARGMTFHAITELTDVPEGTIVRVITRMDEICREVMAAARIIGDASLHDKMALAQEKIKRDIVFCASLYL